MTIPEEDIDALVAAAKATLDPTEAAIFLEWHSHDRESARLLALRYGVTISEIYRIIDAAKKRLRRVMRKTEAAAKSDYEATMVSLANRDHCATCGFVYQNAGWGPPCDRGYGIHHKPDESMHPECRLRYTPFPR